MHLMSNVHLINLICSEYTEIMWPGLSQALLLAYHQTCCYPFYWHIIRLAAIPFIGISSDLLIYPFHWHIIRLAAIPFIGISSDLLLSLSLAYHQTCCYPFHWHIIRLAAIPFIGISSHTRVCTAIVSCMGRETVHCYPFQWHTRKAIGRDKPQAAITVIELCREIVIVKWGNEASNGELVALIISRNDSCFAVKRSSEWGTLTDNGWVIWIHFFVWQKSVVFNIKEIIFISRHRKNEKIVHYCWMSTFYFKEINLLWLK